MLQRHDRSKFTQLRELLQSKDLSFLMEAHSGLSAKIVEEAGFGGVWASGLSISATLGVRDNNELSWTQVLDVLEYMSDATTVPILVDGDTGYGNFNNFRRLVKKLCQRGIAGVCIEDKIFPKTNSFLSEGDDLADIEEFCGKIKAGKDTQEHPDFSVVARIEALIAGQGMDEALKRADAYADAGADALVIHSRKRDADEILEFNRLWDHSRCPVIVIPTKYYRTPTDQFRDAGVSTVIWANHNLRAAIQSMREVSRKIFEQQTLLEIESEVAPLEDVFALANASELEEAEKVYLAAQPERSAVILAATRGSDLGALTEDRPKCMVNVRGQSILARQLDAFRREHVKNVTVVAGYCHDAVEGENISKALNPDYATTGEAASLACARDALTGAAIVGYGDIVFQPFFVSLLGDRTEDFVVLVDPNLTGTDKDRDLVACSAPYEGGFATGAAPKVRQIGEVDAADGQWVGLLGMSADGTAKLRAELDRMEAEGVLAQADMAAVLTRLMARGETVRAIYVSGNWANVNDLADLSEARNTM
ncbi:phosphoenolpyruvate mutase [Psychromarinibacter sp. S121]|uniref:phosphoenolpyruvate mutase n=1 Tax=Psychromarinibacter sp. S121 TaxID=3415127 RepID=UPI003C7CD28E